MSLSDVYNRYNPLKRFAKLFHRGKQFVESGEWNESQDIAYERLGSVGDMVVGQISLRSGGEIAIAGTPGSATPGSVSLGAAKVWAGGYLHAVAAATLANIPMQGIVVIGVAVANTVVTHNEDPSLKGIVPGTESYGEPLAARLRYDAAWARTGNPFYPIFTIVDGVLLTEVAPPANDLGELAVERHVVESHGSHLIEGFDVRALGVTDAEQVFIITAGKARANGKRVSRSVDLRYGRAEAPTLKSVVGEVHSFPGATGGTAEIILDSGPVNAVSLVTIVRRRTDTITHQLAGGADPLPFGPVYAIESVVQGATTYAVNTSFVRTGNTVDWAPGGPEPAPGSSYDVTYTWTDQVTPDEIGRQSIEVTGAVNESPVTVHYTWKMNQVDLLCLNHNGEVIYLEGIPTIYTPKAPAVPFDLVPLVRVSNVWGLTPILEPVGQKAMHVAEERAALRTLVDVYDLLQLLQLEKDALERDPASRRGSFVDPFVNDFQRDAGVAQNAAISGGILQLPLTVTVSNVSLGSTLVLLPFVKETIQAQPFRTADRKINEYQAFEPLVASLTIAPMVDHWMTTDTQWAESLRLEQINVIIKPNWYRGGDAGLFLQPGRQYWEWVPEDDITWNPLEYSTQVISKRLGSQRRTDLVRSEVRPAQYLRQLTIDFQVKDFVPNEAITGVFFDEIPVAHTAGAAVNGVGAASGSFTIPANVPVGRKEVRVEGGGGSEASAIFVGQGEERTDLFQNVTTIIRERTFIRGRAIHYDPVGQSFMLSEPRILTGVRVEFTHRGDPANAVVLQIREMLNGYPASETIAQGEVPGTFALGNPAVASDTNWQEVNTRAPFFTPAGLERFFGLLTDDANHKVAIGQLGQQTTEGIRGFDFRLNQWVRENPHPGVFFKSSNASTWVPEPETDLTFELRAAKFTSNTRVVSLGSFPLVNISDIVVLAAIELPSADTRVEVELVRADASVLRFEPNSRIALPFFLNETVTLRLALYGTEKLSPLVHPDVAIVWGSLQETATYVSQANAVDPDIAAANIRTVIEAYTPGTASVAVDIGAVGAWDAQTGPDTTALGDGWIERDYADTGYTANDVRTRITLTGSPAYRPGVRNLRQRATEV